MVSLIIGDKFKSPFTGKAYAVKIIGDRLVLLESDDKLSQVLTEKERWKVYDVVIEGVSLVNNYRTQFREILANKTPEALLDILRKKVGEARAS